jgi:hypothetical protein
VPANTSAKQANKQAKKSGSRQQALTPNQQRKIAQRQLQQARETIQQQNRAARLVAASAPVVAGPVVAGPVEVEQESPAPDPAPESAAKIAAPPIHDRAALIQRIANFYGWTLGFVARMDDATLVRTLSDLENEEREQRAQAALLEALEVQQAQQRAHAAQQRAHAAQQRVLSQFDNFQIRHPGDPANTQSNTQSGIQADASHEPLPLNTVEGSVVVEPSQEIDQETGQETTGDTMLATSTGLASTPPAGTGSNDVWHWRIHYTDGTILDEYDQDAPDGRGFASVDLPRVRAVELIPQREGLRNHAVKIEADKGMRPIFFRRRLMPVDLSGEFPTGVVVASLTVLGYQKTLEGLNGPLNSSHYTFFFEDGSVLVTDDHNAI